MKRGLRFLGWIIISLFLIGIALNLVLGKDLHFIKGEKIGVVEVTGIIAKTKPIIDQLEKYERDDRIKAIILRVDSPGGVVGAAQEIYQAVNKTKATKKVVASMGSVAASGGYYIAAATDKIVANPGTITGSIGVIVEFSNVEKLIEKMGLKSYSIKSGKFKDVGSPFREMTEEEKAYIKEVVNDIHVQFEKAVAEGRNMPIEKVHSLANGRIFTGRQAKALGLVDVLGNFQDAVDLAKNLAGIKGTPYIIYPERKRPILLRYLIKGLFQDLKEESEGFLYPGYRFSYLALP